MYISRYCLCVPPLHHSGGVCILRCLAACYACGTSQPSTCVYVAQTRPSRGRRGVVSAACAARLAAVLCGGGCSAPYLLLPTLLCRIGRSCFTHCTLSSGSGMDAVRMLRGGYRVRQAARRSSAGRLGKLTRSARSPIPHLVTRVARIYVCNSFIFTKPSGTTNHSQVHFCLPPCQARHAASTLVRPTADKTVSEPL